MAGERPVNFGPRTVAKLLRMACGEAGQATAASVALMPRERGVVHFRSGAGGITAFNETSKQMGSALCRKWVSNTTGLLTDGGVDVMIYNAAAFFAAGKVGIADYNEAGLLVAIVEKCDS